MKTTLKEIEIEKTNTNLTDKLKLREFNYISNIKWFKGSRNRGIRGSYVIQK